MTTDHHDEEQPASHAAPTREARSKGGRPRLVGWEPKFLEHYAEWGSKAQAARAAGVGSTTVRDRERRDPRFAEQVAEAREEFLDGLEMDLVRMGREKNNVIGTLARLKADRPGRYVEKLQIEGSLRQVHEEVPAGLHDLIVHVLADPATDPTARAGLLKGADEATLAEVRALQVAEGIVDAEGNLLRPTRQPYVFRDVVRIGEDGREIPALPPADQEPPRG